MRTRKQEDIETKITGLLTFLIGTFFFYSCDTDVEALEIQKLKTYDEQYFENLRAFKKSDHEISYAYYEAWSPIEGVTGYKDPASWGERMVGLPDSIDIVNLWMGIPTAETHPIAYADMQYCQRKLGTRFVMPDFLYFMIDRVGCIIPVYINIYGFRWMKLRSKQIVIKGASGNCTKEECSD